MPNPIYGHSPHPAGTMFGYDETVKKYRVPKVTPEGGISTIAGLLIPEHDYFSIAYDTTTDTITYKINGASGDIVAVVVITYTDSNKTAISSGERTI